MCTLCSATQIFDPARHPDGEPAFAVVIEGADAPSNTGTPYMKAVGDTFEGSLSLNDNDWVEVSLVAGQSYTLSMSGSSGGGGTLSDSYLYLTNSAGTVIAQNDDGGTGRDSLITFTATATGTYYLVAEAFDPANQSGTYTLEIQAATVSAPNEGTLDELADYLTSGYWGGQQRSFDTASSNVITVNITALTADGQQLARWAFEAWEMVADIDFVETTGGADITFDDNQSGAFASSSFDGNGNIISSEVNVSASWLTQYGTGIDSYSFSTYVHEIGHALGLGHQGSYNGSASYPSDATFSNDSYQISVMSYFSQTDNTSVIASYAEPISAMLADIVAIQSLYGAAGAGSATAGNTTWGEGSSLDNYIDSLTNGDGNYGGGAVAFTVYDAGGVDLFDFSSSTQNQLIDLRAEQFSNINGLIGNVGIARGTIIENVVLHSGDDTVVGNEADNLIKSGEGDDIVTGSEGDDTLYGGTGEDTATFFGEVSDYTFLNYSGFVWVIDLVGNDGRDALSDIEIMAFSNQSIDSASVVQFDALSYIASYTDLLQNIGADGQAGFEHYLNFGLSEGREITFRPYEYIASFSDLRAAFGTNAEAGARHYIEYGFNEGRTTTFSGLEYIASYSDLRAAFGTNAEAGAQHYIEYGFNEGRTTTFSGLEYIASYSDLRAAFGTNAEAGAQHYIEYGINEARSVSFDGLTYLASYSDLLVAFGGDVEAATLHYITYGANEGRSTNLRSGLDVITGVQRGTIDGELIVGSELAEIMAGMEGDDTLIGDRGDDVLVGGSGSDTFVFNNFSGNDLVSDFNAIDENEKIDLSNVDEIVSYDDLMTSHIELGSDGSVIISFGGNQITLVQVGIEDLDASNFIF